MFLASISRYSEFTVRDKLDVSSRPLKIFISLHDLQKLLFLTVQHHNIQ